MTPEEIFESFHRQAEEFSEIVVSEVQKPSVPWSALCAPPKRTDAIAFADELMICPDANQVRERVRRDQKKALAFYKYVGRISEIDIPNGIATKVSRAFSANRAGELTQFCILAFVTKFLVESKSIFGSD
jgi:hypothetical protein